MNYIDPITKAIIPVRSICVPSKTLLQGKEYVRAPSILGRRDFMGNKTQRSKE